MKFREFETSSGKKVLAGRDAGSNEELVKKFQGKENIMIHTVAPGSPFCVIKELNPSLGDVTASGAICARYSQFWRDNKEDTKVNIFTGKDVNKTKGMEVGTWRVKKSRTKTIKKKDILNFQN